MVYYDLDKVDAVARDTTNGLRLFIQTEHRTAAEIEASRDPSTVLALIRMLNPARMGRREGEPFKVVYASSSEVPDFLHQAIVSAGGVLWIDNQERAYNGQSLPADALFDNALRNIVAGVSRRTGLSVNLGGLASLERKLAKARPDRERNAEVYWTSVIELGAFAGEVMRLTKGGGWIASDEAISSMPVLFDCRGNKVNFLGKAIKFYANGESDSVVPLVKVMCQRIDEEDASSATPSPAAPGTPPPKPGFFGRLFGK